MRNHLQSRSAFTLVEMMVAVTILGVAFTMGVAGWAHILVGERRVEAQNELDMDVRDSVERLRADMRASDINKIVYYPAGLGPFSAVSFPVAVPTSATNLMDNGGTNIVWDRTVCYHVFVSSPNQLKRTIFYNRDNSAAVSNRQSQLNRVVLDGHGRNACINNETTSTSTLFANLFDWKLTPNTCTFDCYASSTLRDRYLFGATVLNSGAHTVEFKVIGKNALGNANRYLGIDVLNASVSGADQEAEDQTTAAISGMPSIAKTYMPNGSWSGNYHLLARAGTTNGQGVSVTVQNDCWTESNFETPGALAERTTRDFDTSLSPWYHYVMRLTGATGELWQTGAWYGGGSGESVVANTQCQDTAPDDLQNSPVNVCVRVLIRGEYVRKFGRGPILVFNKSTDNPEITDATFATANVGAYSNTCDAVSGTMQPLTFFQDGIAMNWADCNYGDVYAIPARQVDILPNQSYLVSYYLNDVGGPRNMTHNEDYRNPDLGSYILTNVAASGTMDETWSTNPCLTTDRRNPGASGSPGKIYSLYQMASGWTTNGIYTSIIFDSGQTVATPKTITWAVDTPASATFALYARTGNSVDLSDASDWSALSPLTAPGTFPYNTGRYIQFRAVMGCDPMQFPVPPSPRLQYVKFQWPGDTRMVDVAGILTRGPDYAQCAVTVDGKPLTRAIKVDLTIYKDTRRLSGGPERLTSFATAEVTPRNTGM
jgi:prepilin-type N-terminal cleavage/methylation domain-containing protein